MDLTSATTIALTVVNRNEHLLDTANPVAVNREMTEDSLPFLTSVHADMGRLDVRDRRIVIFTQSRPGLIRASMRDIEANRGQNLSFNAHSEAELVAGIELWKSKIEW